MSPRLLRLLLLLLVIALVSCTARRRGGDDDDDNDSAVDDDDTVDDDDSGDDDDDDDDDDDTTGEQGFAAINVTPGSLTISPGASGSATVTLSNTAAAPLSGTVALNAATSPGAFVLAGSPTVTLSAFGSTTRTLTFSTTTPGSYYARVDFTHDGSNDNPMWGELFGTCAASTETSCTDGVDNDGDALVDCDDPDCATDPACAGSGPDACCSATGTATTWTTCLDSGAINCVCDLDGWCCLGGWDVTCRNYYSGTCGASCP